MPTKNNWQKEWDTISMTDSEWLRVRKNGTEPTLEVAEEIGTYEDEEGVEQRKYLLYRFDVEQYKLTREPEDPLKVYLVPSGYNSTWPHHPKAYEPWFSDSLADVAKSVGRDPLDLAKMFTSPSPSVRANAHMEVAGYHGLANFDSDPLELNEPELDKRWK